MAAITYIALDALRIGVVDDNPYFRRLLRAMLKGMSVQEVIEGQTVAEGWEIASRRTPDILLIDWNLGAEDGIRLLDRIRTHPTDAIATQAVVFLSAHTDKRHVLTAARLGANDFIVKPVSPRVLYERLGRLAKTRIAYRRVGDRLVPEMGLGGHRVAAPPPPPARPAAPPVAADVDAGVHFL